MLYKRIKELRLSYNLNQVQFANKLSVAKQTVSNWENNNIQPSIDMLLKISDFYGVTTDYLLGRDDKKYICADHLTDDEIAHINQIIKDITKNR